MTLEIEWKEEWFRIRSRVPPLRDKAKVKQFMQSLSQKLNIKDQRDWAKVPDAVWRFGLIEKSGSVYKLLKYVFPGFLLR